MIWLICWEACVNVLWVLVIGVLSAHLSLNDSLVILARKRIETVNTNCHLETCGAKMRLALPLHTYFLIWGLCLD